MSKSMKRDFVHCLHSFTGASQTEEEGKEKGERRHSHMVVSMTDSLTLPLLSSPTSLPRTSKTTMGVCLCTHAHTQLGVMATVFNV